MNRKIRIAKEGAWVIANQVAAVLGGLALVRVLTEYLDPQEYGHVALALTVAGFVNQVVMGGLGNAIGRYYSIAVENADLPGYYRAARRLLAYATIVVAAIGCLLTAGLLFFGYSQWVWLAVAALMLSTVAGYNGSLNSLQNAARRRVVVAVHGVLDAWLKVLVVIALMSWFTRSSTLVVMGYALASLLVLGSQLIVLRRLSDPLVATSRRPPTDWTSQMWAFASPFCMWGAFTWAQQASDRWALQGLGTSQDVGLYAVLFQLGYAPIGLAIGAAMTLLGPILYQRSGSTLDQARNDSVHSAAWRVALVCLFVTALVFIGVLALHARIFALLVAPAYRQVSYLLPWMVLAGGVFSAGQILSLKLMAEMKPASMLGAKVITALLGVGLNIYGAFRFGLPGVVAALSGFSLVYFVWMVWLARHVPASNAT